jgi:glycosyltransferase involved in cell wall biosynthesis
MPANIKSLFIVDGSLDRPILHSQGLPLIRHLSDKEYHCWILSFEEKNPSTQSILWQDLVKRGIKWIPITIGANVVGAKRTQVILRGIVKTFQLCRRESIYVVHCRSYRPAIIGSLIKTLTGTGFLFDMRGFLIDEQVILGRWKVSGVKYNLARLFEKWCILNADAIITTSPQFRQRLLALTYFPREGRAGLVYSISNCADTSRFIVNHPLRDEIRGKMAWNNRFVIAFAGEARTWEGFEQILEFFLTMQRINPHSYLAIFAYGDLSELRKIIEVTGLNPLDYCMLSIPPDQMPAYLGAVDLGVVFRRHNQYTQTIASPIKFAEYLSCGLPVVINPGIGDTSRIVEQYNVGVVLDPDNNEQLKAGAVTLHKLIATDPDLRQRCHRTAEQELSLDLAVEQYLQVYQMVIAASELRMKR